MKLLAFIPLLILVSCQENLRSRSLIDDSIRAPAGTSTTTPNNPTIPTTEVANTLHPRCQSSYRCLYTTMPVYDQDATGLENYVGNKIGVANYNDPGLCAPTSAAMMLRAVLNERNANTKLNNSFLESVKSRPWYETIYQIGLDSSTNFVSGGTSLYGIYSSFDSYFQNTVAQKGFYLTLQSSWAQSAYVSNQDIIKLIRSKKPTFFTVIDALQKHETTTGGVKKTWHQNASTVHGVVIKGFDGDRLHIQDPWGMDHFARLEHEQFAQSSQGPSQIHGVFKGFTNNTSHFMGRYGQDRKIKLTGMIALSLD